MTAIVLSIGTFLVIAALLYALGLYVIRAADARYDRSSAETRRKDFR